MAKRNKAIPRPFNFKNVGKGMITHEAANDNYKDWTPSIQVLKFDNGTKAIRFCYYISSGQIARNALFLNQSEVADLKNEIAKQPEVKKFLKELLE